MKFIANNFGSKQGIVKYFWYKYFALMLTKRRLKTVDFSRVKRVVFVCHGNICRSALADIVFKRGGLNGVQVVSCGLKTSSDKPANARAIQYSKDTYPEIEDHRTTRVQELKFDDTDLVVCMEPLHLREISEFNSSSNSAQLTLLGLWGDVNVPYIHDPYNTNDIFFKKCIGLVERSTKNLKEKLLSQRTE